MLSGKWELIPPKNQQLRDLSGKRELNGVIFLRQERNELN